jgi:hypothetical protein
MTHASVQCDIPSMLLAVAKPVVRHKPNWQLATRYQQQTALPKPKSEKALGLFLGLPIIMPGAPIKRLTFESAARYITRSRKAG